MRLLIICMMAVVLCCLLPHHVMAAEESQLVTFLSGDDLKKHDAQIRQVEDYLTGLTTVVANFNQVAPDGTLTSGKFYMQRPGKMRWQYNPPTPILMVANGIELVYYDYELEQVSHIPLNDSLISFMAREKISFDDKVGIISFEDAEGIIRITMAEREKPNEGQLLLEFTTGPLIIRNMVITDATKQVTSVALSGAEFGTKIDKELFIFRDPRKPRKRT